MNGPVGEIAGKGAQGAIAKVGASILEKLVDKVTEVVKDRQTWANLFLQYENKYFERYGIVKLLGMPQELALDQVYTGVRILDDVSIRQFESLEALEETYRERGIRRLQQAGCLLREDGQPENGIQVANQYSCLMVLGGPGAGKSTFLRRIGLAAARGEAQFFEHDCIPVMLELKQFKEPQVDLQAAVAQEFANVGFDFSQPFVEEALKQGKLLVLFDGLDEVPKANQDKVIDAIQNFVNRYGNNRFMASCRVAAYRSSFQNFTEIELADFDNKQIQQFIYNWFTTDVDQANKTAEQCWNLLNENSQKSAKELAQTPLLLTFLCIYYDKKQSFAAHRATLYRTALDILLEEWAAEKRIRHEPVYEGLNTELEKVMLAEIAYEGFVNDQLFFTQQELLDQIKQFLEDSVDKPKYLDSRKVLDEIAAQQGILVERAEDVYSFSHLTLQEYLVAQHISQTDDANQGYESIVRQYLTQQRWQEVLLLVPGLLPKADKLLQLMQQIADQEISSSSVPLLLIWAEKITANVENEFSPVTRRCIALALASDLAGDVIKTSGSNVTNGLANTSFLISVLTNTIASISARMLAGSIRRTRLSVLTINSAPNLVDPGDHINVNARILASINDLAQMFNALVNFVPLLQKLESLLSELQKNQISPAQVETFSKFLPQFWCEALNLDSELLSLSPADVQALNNYLYITELMVRCKQSSVRVSRDVWEEITRRMLLPPIVESQY